MITKCILSMNVNHRFITLSSPYSQSFMVCNRNLRFPDWIQTESFGWWSHEIVGILLSQRSPFFSYPAYAIPRGQWVRDSLLYTSFISGPAQLRCSSLCREESVTGFWYVRKGVFDALQFIQVDFKLLL